MTRTRTESLIRFVGFSLFKTCVLLFLTLSTLDIAFAQLPTNQSQPGAGTRRNFTVYGDLRIDESNAGGPVPQTFDVILYTRGGEVFARQRLGNNGRYRFMNVFNGDYYLAVEVENVEIVRMPILVAGQLGDDIRKDLDLQWRSGTTRRADAGVISAADIYERAGRNKTLYEKAQQEIEQKNFPEAIALLQEIIAADQNDFVATSDLGMLYFIDKKYDEAENSYTHAVNAKPTYFPAMLNLGRVQIAKKSFENAVASLEAALKLNNHSAPANYFLGEAYLQLKKGSKAVVYFNEALKLDPKGMAEAHLRVAALYNGAGYKDRAAAEYEQFLRKQPNYPDRKKLEDYIISNKSSSQSQRPK